MRSTLAAGFHVGTDSRLVVEVSPLARREHPSAAVSPIGECHTENFLR